MDKLEKLSDEIFDKQREVEKMLNELFLMDEQTHSEVLELLRDGNY